MWQNFKNNLPFGLKRNLKDLLAFFHNLASFSDYYRDWQNFAATNDGRFDLKPANAFWCLRDKTATTPYDAHYIYHPAWAARVIAQYRPAKHIDIASSLSFCTVLSAFVITEFYDYRPADLHLSNLASKSGNLLNLPFADNSIESLSCMHTLEHVGLGRYGDALDAQGDLKAMRELIRVLSVGGHLLVVVPVGRPKLMFNAHRIYSFAMISEIFSSLKLLDFSLVTDTGQFIDSADPSLVAQQDYGCGCFWYSKIL